MLTIKHLTKQFGKKTLFRDLCLTVEGPAVLWAPSGWGKTTLLRILMGLEEPTSGIVQGVGRVAAVFQEDRQCRTIQRANHKRFSTVWHGCCCIGPACSTAFRRTEATHGSAAGFVGRQRYAAVRRTLYRNGPGHPCRCCGSAAGALRRKACLAGYPRPRSHPPSGLAGG